MRRCIYLRNVFGGRGRLFPFRGLGCPCSDGRRFRFRILRAVYLRGIMAHGRRGKRSNRLLSGHGQRRRVGQRRNNRLSICSHRQGWFQGILKCRPLGGKHFQTHGRACKSLPSHIECRQCRTSRPFCLSLHQGFFRPSRGIR